MKYDVRINILINGAERRVTFAPPSDETSGMTVVIDERRIDADGARISAGVYSILLGGRSLEATVEDTAEGLLVSVGGREFRVNIIDPRSWQSRRGGSIELAGRQQVAAPMPGKIVNLLVAPGQRVEAGQGLLVIEAMKMQNEIRSPKSGAVEQLRVSEGQTVKAGEVLVIIA